MGPDYRAYVGGTHICHSAKGSTWKKHKYVKVMEGVYFYPNDYKGGRHIAAAAKFAATALKDIKKKNKDSSASGKNSKDGKEEKSGSGKMSDKKIEKLAQKVISGKYGNGKERMDKLGKKYDKVQHRVNQILLGEAGAKRILDRKNAAKKAAASNNKTSSSKKASTSKSKSSNSSKKKK